MARLSCLGALALPLCCTACSDAEVLEDPQIGDPALSSGTEELQIDWAEEALRAEQEGDWERAADALDRLRGVEDPGDLWIERRLRAADAVGDPGTGAFWREELLGRRPEDLPVRLRLAQDLQAIGRGLEGAMLLEAVATDPSSRILALRALGELYRDEEHWLDAAAAFERLASDERLPDRGVILQMASRLREKGGDLEGAIRIQEEALRAQGVKLRPEEERTLDRLQAFQTGQPTAVRDAIDLALRHPDPGFRLNGARFLAREEFDRAVPVFAALLEDAHAPVITVALRELGLRAVDESAAEHAPLLVPFLAHLDGEVRHAAARALGDLGQPESMPDLIAALDPADRSWFRAVRKALVDISGTSMSAELDPDEAERAAIAAAWRAWSVGEARPPGPR